MKRLLLVAAIVLVASAAYADVADRDVLITTDGTVYSVSAQPSEDGLTSSLVLSVQPAGGKEVVSTLPESIESGVNVTPTLAYDVPSKSLFVFWMRMPSAGSSELLVARYLDAKWEPAIVIDSKPVLHTNLSVGFTQQVQSLQRDETFAPTPALILHAAWWERNGEKESAHYAVMPLSRGWSTKPDIHDMTEFADAPDTARESDEPFGDFMRHVAIVEGPTPDAVDVIYAVAKTNSFYRTTLRPIADARVHITVGVHNGPKLGGPGAKSIPADWNGKTSTITSHDGKTVIFCNTTATKVMWVTMRDGKWLPVQEIALSDKVTASTAMAALTKMASQASQ